MIQSNNPFISILICCYNSEKFIIRTLDSVLSQKYTNWELIIIDDGSYDKTKEIIFKKLKNKKFNYYYQENIGLANSRNKGLLLSKSNYVFILDHDDEISSDRLIKQVKEIKTNEDCAIYFGDAKINSWEKITKFQIFKKKYDFNINKLKNKNRIDNFLLEYGCFIPSSTVVINKDKIKSNFLFNNRYNYVVDFDYFLRVSKTNKIFMSENIYSCWYESKNQITYQNKLKNYIEIFIMYNDSIINNIKYLINYKIIKVYFIILLNIIYLFLKK